MSAGASLERFGERDLLFIKWRLCKHCFKNEWTLSNQISACLGFDILYKIFVSFCFTFFYKNQNSLEFLTISFIRLERPDEASIKHEMCQTSIFSGITQWGQHIFEAALNLLPQCIFRKFFTIRYFEKYMVETIKG